MRSFIFVFNILFIGYSYALPVPAIINAKKQAEMASPMSGIIINTSFREGQTFTKSQKLIIFKCNKQLSEQDREKAVVDKKITIYQGYKRLKALKAISKIEVMEAKADYLEAKAQWEIASYNVNDCTVKAPFDGQIIKLYVHEHEHIDVGKPLLDIVSFDALEIKIIAPSTWLSWIKKGMSFKIDVQETGLMYEASVLRFNHYIDPVSRTFSIFAKFIKQPQGVFPGMSGQAIFKEAL